MLIHTVDVAAIFNEITDLLELEGDNFAGEQAAIVGTGRLMTCLILINCGHLCAI